MIRPKCIALILGCWLAAAASIGCSRLNSTDPHGEKDHDLVPINLLAKPVTIASMQHPLEIPFPLYPNGTKYRAGGENGLNIVVYETSDDLNKVDGYFKSQAQQNRLNRYAVMEDYVRYDVDSRTHEDPWSTTRPGIIIHTFNNEKEAVAYGAAAYSKTNIIISYP